MGVMIRNMHLYDIPAVDELFKLDPAYSTGWSQSRLIAQLRAFTEGQFVAVDRSSGTVLGFAASLIVRWRGEEDGRKLLTLFEQDPESLHDPFRGDTLLGAGLLVDPRFRGKGLGSGLDSCRKNLAKRLKLPRMRVFTSLNGPALGFRLGRGFRVSGILERQWAVVEWVNHKAAGFRQHTLSAASASA